MNSSDNNEQALQALLLEILSKINSLVDHSSADTPWLTTREAATYLRCSVRKVDQLSATGLIPYKRQDHTLHQSSKLFHRKQLTAFIVAGKNSSKQRLTTSERKQVDELA